MDPISKFNSLSLVFESTNLKATLETKSNFSYHVLKQREFLAIDRKSTRLNSSHLDVG